MCQIFDDEVVSKKVKEELDSIKKLDLEKALHEIDTDAQNCTSITEDAEQVMLKVDKKSNVKNVIEYVITTLMNILGVDRKTINKTFNVKNYNNVVYVTRKY